MISSRTDRSLFGAAGAGVSPALLAVAIACHGGDGGSPASPDANNQFSVDATRDGSGSQTTNGVDADGVTQIYQPTMTASVALEYGARHDNGDRYNANHTFISYEVTGYYLTSETEKIEMKTDGPNHGGCDDLPDCQWVEPRIDIADGRASISSEWPHPTNHDDANCPSCKTLNINLEHKWIGYKVIAYPDANGMRVYEQWLDPDGLDANDKPVNNWVLMMRETNTGQVMPNPDRDLPLGGDGLEAEIRCHGGHDTEMKYGKIQEIVAPAM
ncbi:MAG: hypothetical protein AB7P03_22205 [Kofleriaceae bacterium]